MRMTVLICTNNIVTCIPYQDLIADDQHEWLINDIDDELRASGGSSWPMSNQFWSWNGTMVFYFLVIVSGFCLGLCLLGCVLFLSLFSALLPKIETMSTLGCIGFQVQALYRAQCLRLRACEFRVNDCDFRWFIALDAVYVGVCCLHAIAAHIPNTWIKLDMKLFGLITSWTRLMPRGQNRLGNCFGQNVFKLRRLLCSQNKQLRRVGGHLYSGLALLRAILEDRLNDWDIFLICLK